MRRGCTRASCRRRTSGVRRAPRLRLGQRRHRQLGRALLVPPASTSGRSLVGTLRGGTHPAAAVTPLRDRRILHRRCLPIPSAMPRSRVSGRGSCLIGQRLGYRCWRWGLWRRRGRGRPQQDRPAMALAPRRGRRQHIRPANPYLSALQTLRARLVRRRRHRCRQVLGRIRIRLPGRRPGGHLSTRTRRRRARIPHRLRRGIHPVEAGQGGIGDRRQEDRPLGASI
jgi:hypothetical protein